MANAGGWLQFDKAQSAEADGKEKPLEGTSSTVDAVVVAVVCATLCLPFLRSIFWLADEGVWLRAAMLLGDGKTLYKDFFEVLPPIGFLITRIWLMFAGHSLVGARVLMVLCIAGISFLTCLICLRISKSRPVSAALTLIWALSSQGFWTQINHHWFTTFFSLITFIALLPNRNQRIQPFLCGLAGGASAWTTSTRGALIVSVAFLSILSRGNKVDTWKYLAGVVAISAFVLLYTIANGAFYAAYQDIIVWAAARYSDIQHVPFGYATHVQDFAVTLMYPLAAVSAIMAMLHGRLRMVQDYNFRTALAFGIGGFLGCYPRPDASHLLWVAPLILPLLSISLVRILHRPWQTRVVMVALIGLMAASLLGYYRAVKATVRASPVVTAAGKVSFVPSHGEPELLMRIATIGPGQAFLFYPFDPMLSFLTGREHVARSDLLLPHYSTPAQYAAACVQTVRRADWVVIDRSWTNATLRYVFPAMANPQPPEKVFFERAIESSFAVVGRYGNYELRKKERSDESVCASIHEVGQGEITPGS